MLLSNERNFLVQGKRSQHVRRSIGDHIRECHMDQCVKHTPKKMFWGSFSYYGVRSLLPIEGMMNAEKYTKVVEKNVVVDLANAFWDGSGGFQHGSAPYRKAKNVMDHIKKIKITVLNCQGNSQDLNPIENLWSTIKLRLRKENYTDKAQLIEAIIRIWYRDPRNQRKCQTLEDSMPNRVLQVIKNGDGHLMC